MSSKILAQVKHLSILLAAGLMLSAFPNLSFSYELVVHSRMTIGAYEQSILADPEFIKQLGLEENENPFGIKYYDIFDDLIEDRTEIREIQAFERKLIRKPYGTEPLSIKGWVTAGAIREDDHYDKVDEEDDCLYVDAPNPEDDPYSRISRVLNHFYDPVNVRHLTVAGIAHQCRHSSRRVIRFESIQSGRGTLSVSIKMNQCGQIPGKSLNLVCQSNPTE